MKSRSIPTHHPRHARRRSLRLPFGAQRFSAVLEGIEGGFAISASIVAGLFFSGMSRHILITTVVVSILVNGFNTAAVKYSSEHFLDELDGREKRSPFRHYFIPSLIEFCIYLSVGLVTILPLLLVGDLFYAVMILIAVTISILFVAGWWRGKSVRLHPLKDALETCLLGAAIITTGAVAGWLLYGF